MADTVGVVLRHPSLLWAWPTQRAPELHKLPMTMGLGCSVALGTCDGARGTQEAASRERPVPPLVREGAEGGVPQFVRSFIMKHGPPRTVTCSAVFRMWTWPSSSPSSDPSQWNFSFV